MMAPPSETVAPLGDLEWAAIGGKVDAHCHPSGRITYVYIAPDGGEKFRSWRQALVYMGEDESGPLAQQARERHNNLLKSSLKSPNPRSSGKRQQKSSSQSPNSPASSQGQQQVSGPENGGSPIAGNHSPRRKSKKSKDLFPKPVTPPPTGDSSSPHSMSGRKRKEAPGNRTKKPVSPSTFTGAVISGSSSQVPKDSNTVPRPSNARAMSPGPSQSSSQEGAGEGDNTVEAKPRPFLRGEPSSVESPPKEPFERTMTDVAPSRKLNEAERKRSYRLSSTSTERHISPATALAAPESRKKSQQAQGGVRSQMSSRQDLVILDSSADDEPAAAGSGAAPGPGPGQERQHSTEAADDAKARANAKKRQKKKEKKAAAAAELLSQAVQAPPGEQQQASVPQEAFSVELHPPGPARVPVPNERQLQSGESGRTGGGSSSDFCAGEDTASDGGCVRPHKEPPSRRPRRAAAGKDFKEKEIRLDETDARIETKMPALGESKEDLIILSTSKGNENPPQRGLLDFVIHDDDGNYQQIERIGFDPVYFTGFVNPIVGDTDKEKCVKCECLGPIVSWSITGYEDGRPVIVLCTEMAEYFLQNPIGAYRKTYQVLFEKVRVCVEAYRLLSKPDGGDPDMHMDDLIARLSRVFSRQGPSGQFFSREFVIRNGIFVHMQLFTLDEAAGKDDQLFTGLPSLLSLAKAAKETKEAAACRSKMNFVGQYFTLQGAGSSAVGGSSNGHTQEDSMLTDEQLARHLQEEEADRGSNVPSKKQAVGKPKYYVKINEAEIANDYPTPEYYKAEEEEMDEYILFDDYTVANPDDLPHRKLQNWTLYNSDARLVSLELLPMLPGAETDTEIFGSGIITEDDGTEFSLDGEDAGAGGAEGSSTAEARSAGSGSEQGIRVYLSALKEWKIEFGAGMLFISFRTDGAWYRLGQPSTQYYPWYQPVLKTARVAIQVITMLQAERRVNLLSFGDVIKKLMNQKNDQPTYISGRQPLVERYVIVHGQIILQQFSEYPDERIKRCAFITGLVTKMEMVRHTKLKLSKKRISKKEKNLNPRAITCPDGHKRKPMRATTTRLVDSIWSGYYAGTGEGEATEEAEGAEKEVDVVEEEFVEDSDDEEIVEQDLRPAVRDPPKKKLKNWKGSTGDLKWIGEAETRTANKERVFRKAIFRGVEYAVGTVVLATLDEGNGYAEASPVFVLIEYFYETKREGPLIHGRVMQKGVETILGNAARERELFLTDLCEDVELDKVKSFVAVEMWNRRFGFEYRKENAEKDAADKAAAKDRERRGLPLEYFCRSWYSPERGGFFSLRRETLALGTGSCKACQSRREAGERLDVQTFANDQGFRFQGVDYRINDYMYLDPETFESKTLPTARNGLFKGGRNKGLRAFAICQLLSVLPLRKGGKETDARLMKVRRFYRPEDVDKFKAYKADIHEVYYSEVTPIVDSTTARGKCLVVRQIEEVAESEKRAVNDVFFCDCTHDPATGAVKQLPINFKLSSGSSLEDTVGKSQAEEIVAKTKGKGKAPEYEAASAKPTDPALSTLDIFAGCGGLAEGLHQSGASTTKWAVEYDYPAAEAFKLNHPTAAVFCDNCNVILRSIMEVGGDLDDCISTTEATELSLKMDGEKKRRLPRPGQVDFISGGPPCQGFSGMNRFNTRAWSKVQCEMILSYLSYAEYLRPNYFLLENVRNFVSFNKGQTFRLTLMTLLEMGYQVRFGVLQAGNYGVAQSRKRAFIWAAAPEETLPEWPQPRHVFASSQLGVTLPGNFHYSAVRDAGLGAPFRAITVRDTVADLPEANNGDQTESLNYKKPPMSWFQGHIRGEATRLLDHICKEMNELNLIRCQRIPKEPGADWRTLPDEKVKLSTGQMADLIPWCLPNTAKRHNQWKGLFGRLDWDGNFPTSITDPQPMGKVGMCFHPEQDRIVTVRECARSQGFPDRYKFFGNINAKHRQIGNAVPPPLARALGLMLKEAIKGRKSDEK